MSYTSPPIEKVFPKVESALSGLLHDGMSIMSGGFGLCGNAEACIDAIARSRVKNLTIISNNCGNAGQGLAVLLKNRQVSRVICSFVGGNPDLAELYMKGQVKVELSPQGTFAERIRAGGAGIAGFYTPTGVGTVVAEGKEVREIDGKKLRLRAAAARRPGDRARRRRRHRRQPPLLPDRAQLQPAHGDGGRRHHRRGRQAGPPGRDRSRRRAPARHLRQTDRRGARPPRRHRAPHHAHAGRAVVGGT